MVDESKPEPQIGGFSETWLSLREPADHAARSQMLSEKLQAWAIKQDSLHILEMGTGTGSNLRYLCPLLGHKQHWTLLDNDVSLLERLPEILQQWANRHHIHCHISSTGLTLQSQSFSARLQWRQIDLASELQQLPFEQSDLITGSALLDLSSESWLQSLAEQCLLHHCASFFVLNYDGRINWQPPLDGDLLVRQLLNTHQLSDKGFGSAMGPAAGSYFAKQLRNQQQVMVESSDWQIDADQQALQSALIEGWTEAALEVLSLQSDATKTANSVSNDIQRVQTWCRDRNKRNLEGKSALDDGHTDILALPLE